MKKRLLSFLLIAVVVFTQVFFVIPLSANVPEVKNIIYMIADGGGYPLYDLANEVKKAGGINPEKFPHKTPTDSSPLALKPYLAGSMVTLINPYLITDSAAAATAMSTGFKTGGGRLGVDVNSKPKAHILEAAQSIGKATGLISTYEWMHATPAGFAVHVMDRNDYYNIYQQIENKGIDVVLGSGYGKVSDYASIKNAEDKGYLIVESKADLNFVLPGDRLWGNIVEDSFPYDINLKENQPSLAQMTKAAITALSGDEDGFFLMVEGGKVDNAAHLNNALGTTSEYLAFDEAFRVALDFAKGRTDTVILCAPDHDTGSMVMPEDLDSAISLIQNGTVPSTDVIQWGTTNHSEQNVGVWMYVPEGVPVIEGLNPNLGDSEKTRTDYVVDNTDLARYCAKLMGVDLARLTEELFIDVTDLGTYSDTTGKFTFDKGDKYIYKNQSVYYEDGKEISLGHKEGFELAGRFYVPSEVLDVENISSPVSPAPEVIPTSPVSQVTSVTIDPKEATVGKGDGFKLSSFIRGEGNYSKEIVWSVEGSVHQDTKIARDGYLLISPDETAQSFTVMAKSKESGNIADSCIITVGDAVSSTPDGSRAHPYLIGSAEDFKAFSDGLIEGDSYLGKHFKQTKDIDMSNVPGYLGVGSKESFAGIYDGNGHTINVNITSDSDGCLFPYTQGIIMNLSVSGFVNNSSYAGAICRSLRSGGIIINCYSDASVSANAVGGIAWTNYGTVANCYFNGTVKGGTVAWPIAQMQSGSKMFNNYYLAEKYSEEEAFTGITASQLANDLATWLNRDMEKSSIEANIPYPLKSWIPDGDSPAFDIPNVTAEETKSWKNPFTDVNATDWFFEGVKYVNEKGLMNGLNEIEFAPKSNITRAMLVTVLYRLCGSPSVFGGLPFSDVAEGSYYEFAVAWAKNNGIVKGVTETKFSPDENLTREQIAAIMHRFAIYKGLDVSVGENTNILSYDDFFDISEYAIASLQWTAGSGLLKGKTESTLNPKDNATRGEIAVILARFLESVTK